MNAVILAERPLKLASCSINKHSSRLVYTSLSDPTSQCFVLLSNYKLFFHSLLAFDFLNSLSLFSITHTFFFRTSHPNEIVVKETVSAAFEGGKYTSHWLNIDPLHKTIGSPCITCGINKPKLFRVKAASMRIETRASFTLIECENELHINVVNTYFLVVKGLFKWCDCGCDL